MPAIAPYWPRLLRRERAAQYLSLPLAEFDQLRIQPVRVLASSLYDREDLDAWATGLKGNEDWLSKLDED